MRLSRIQEVELFMIGTWLGVFTWRFLLGEDTRTTRYFSLSLFFFLKWIWWLNLMWVSLVWFFFLCGNLRGKKGFANDLLMCVRWVLCSSLFFSILGLWCRSWKMIFHAFFSLSNFAILGLFASVFPSVSLYKPLFMELFL